MAATTNLPWTGPNFAFGYAKIKTQIMTQHQPKGMWSTITSTRELVSSRFHRLVAFFPSETIGVWLAR